MRTYQRPHLPALLLAATATAAVAAGQQKGPVVKLPNGGGSIRGDQLDELNVHRFLGIPFAEPPVRERRWTSPVPAKSWAPAVRSATEWAPNCMQLDPPAWPTMAKNVSEDCLYLNVFSPAPMDEQQQSLRYPVLVWIHGGGYAYGGAHDSELDGTQLADLANVVVVTIQYRLDVFGWLGSNSLRSRSEDNSTGNWGIQDQRLALKWVKQNIDAFNGNSSQVMIFGESAGVSAEATRLRCPACMQGWVPPACLPLVVALTWCWLVVMQAGGVSNHVAMPKSWGLFERATMQSGGFQKWVAKPLEQAEANFRELVRSIGCEPPPPLAAAAAPASPPQPQLPGAEVQAGVATEATEAVIECLVKKSPEELLAHAEGMRLPYTDSWDGCQWSPVSEVQPCPG
jgi:carboxylesterase type B